MRFYCLLLCTCAVLGVSILNAQPNSDIRIAKPESWVVETEADFEAQPTDAEMEGIYYLLLERQTNIEKESKYFQCAYRIVSVDGLQENADISVNFDPSYEQVTFHEISIVREGNARNQLHPAAIKVVQKEQQMDRYLYDNSLTAIIHLKDLRVGDVVVYSFTRDGFNSVFNHHYSEQFYFQYSIPFEKGHFRVVSPKSKKLYFEYKNDAKRPTTSSSKDSWVFTWNFDKVDAISYPGNTPSWYIPNQMVEITDFKSWDEVNQWALQYYRIDLGEQAKLKTEVGDYFLGENREATALNIIRFVQDEVRYLGFEDGMHSHKPHPVRQVFKQRYGDCKDKSLLLCALMKCYEIDANPVLVNASLRHAVSDKSPAISAFDHVVAQIVMGGDTAYVDPTISNQGGRFGDVYFPTYQMGLVIHPENGGLKNISQSTLSKIEEESLFTIKKVGEGASLLVNTKYYGIDADITRQQLAGISTENLQESYLDFYANLYPTAVVEFPLKIQDDRKKNILHITEYYDIPQMWDTIENHIYADFYPMRLNEFTDIPSSVQRQQEPYQLNYPTHFIHNTVIRLPEPWNVTEDAFETTRDEYKYSRSLTYASNEVQLNHDYQTLESYVDGENMNQFVSDHQQIYNNLAFQLNYDLAYANLENAKATPAIVISIIAFLFGLWLMIKVYRFEPKSDLPVEANNQQPIGGWLVLFSIGVIFGPILLAIQIFIQDGFFDAENWVEYMQTGNIFYSLFISFQLFANIILLLFSVTFAILFFQRRSSVPKLVTLKYAANFLFLLFLMLFGIYFVEEVQFTERDWFDIVKVAIGGVIWIWYFSVSQRVSETFVSTRAKNSGQMQEPHHELTLKELNR